MSLDLEVRARGQRRVPTKEKIRSYKLRYEAVRSAYRDEVACILQDEANKGDLKNQWQTFNNRLIKAAKTV